MPDSTLSATDPSLLPDINLQDFFDNAPIGIYTSTPDGCFLAANPTMATMFGYASPQDLISSVTDIAGQLYVDPADREEFKRVVEEQGEVKDQEFRMVRRDGTVIWVSRSGRGVRDLEGNIVQYQGVITDISQRNVLVEELRERPARFNTVVDNMFDLVSITDLEGNFNFLGAPHSILGYELETLIGKNVLDYVHPDDQPHVVAVFKDFISRQDSGRKVEYRYRRADGEYLWFETVGKIIQDEYGNPKEILFSTRDFTQRKRAEEALRQSEAKHPRAILFSRNHLKFLRLVCPFWNGSTV